VRPRLAAGCAGVSAVVDELSIAGADKWAETAKLADDRPIMQRVMGDPLHVWVCGLGWRLGGAVSRPTQPIAVTSC
jgi:hypothetical protein